MVGNVSKSYVKNCTVHHANNRAIAIHGVNHLTVSWNVFDTRATRSSSRTGPRCAPILQPRGDGAAHLVSLLVDQSPACYWIVNPDNDVYGNAAARVALRVLVPPAREARRHLGPVRGGAEREAVSHLHLWRAWRATSPIQSATASRSRTTSHGRVVPPATLREPATFRDFLGWNNGRFGVWGEFLWTSTSTGCGC